MRKERKEMIECLTTPQHKKQIGYWVSERKERKEMLYLMMHSTHFMYGYMVKDKSDSERGNLLPPLLRLLFSNSSKVSFICTIPQTG